MFFVIFGEDSYRSRQKLTQIISQYKEKNQTSLSLFFFDYDNSVSFSDIEIAVKQISMFTEKKLIVISNFFNSKTIEDQEAIINLLENFKEAFIFFIFYDFKIKTTNKLFKFLKKENAQIQEFKPLTRAETKNWVIKELKKRGVEITKDALSLFLDSIENDTWKIQNEINKLLNYCKEKKIIEIDDVKLLIHPKEGNNIFQTIEAIANKDKKKALKLIYNHIQKGDNELYILSMIAYQFKNLLVIRDLIDKSMPYSEIAQKLKMHPFVLKNNYQQASLFKISELKNIYNKILKTDLDIKQGLNPQLGLELLIEL